MTPDSDPTITDMTRWIEQLHEDVACADFAAASESLERVNELLEERVDYIDVEYSGYGEDL